MNKVFKAIAFPFEMLWIILKLIWIGMTHKECPACKQGINMLGETCPICDGGGLIPSRQHKRYHAYKEAMEKGIEHVD